MSYWPTPRVFQHTAARRRLGDDALRFRQTGRFNTQPPEGGWVNSSVDIAAICQVSTHSRPKAAGRAAAGGAGQPARFNTQPPEGGWFN